MGAGPRSHVDLPAVVAEERMRVARYPARVAHDSVDIQRRVVVAEERITLTRSAMVRREVVGCAEDRVVRVVDVSAEAIHAPRRRLELHRSLRTRSADVPNLAERRLEEVDGGQQLP